MRLPAPAFDRMSDYCAGCAYDPKIKLGTKACPFNYLYWNFLIVNEARLNPNPRMALPYRSLASMTAKRRQVPSASKPNSSWLGWKADTGGNGVEWLRWRAAGKIDLHV